VTSGDDDIPPEVLGMVIENLCREHLDGTAPFPPELLDALCEMFLALADHARSLTKPDMPGVRAAHGADMLAFLGMSDRQAQRLAAKHSGVEFAAVRQAHKRMRHKRRGRGQKRT
jgi:hypothetical protein